MRILDKIEYVWKDEWFYKRLIRNTVIYPYIYIYVNKFHHIEISMYMYICTYVWFYILHGVEEHVRGICWFLIRCNCHREALQRKTEFLCGRMLWKNHDVIFVKESHWTKRTPIQIAKKTSAHNGIDINMNIYLYMGLFGVSWSPVQTPTWHRFAVINCIIMRSVRSKCVQILKDLCSAKTRLMWFEWFFFNVLLSFLIFLLFVASSLFFLH